MHRARPRRVLLSILLALCAAWLIAASVSDARAQSGPGVFYSYEQIQIGEAAQGALVPRVMNRPMTGDLESDVRMLFKTLSSAKRPTYGRSEIETDPGGLARGRGVTIRVDPEKEPYRVIIEAEVLATLAVLGIDEVTFAGATERTLSTAQVPFATFSLVVPAWMALPPAAPAAGEVQLPGRQMTVEAFVEAVKSRDGDVTRLILQELAEGSAISQVGLLERLPGLGLPGWQEATVALLGGEAEQVVKLAAIKALSGASDQAALEALVAIVDESEAPELQAAAAQALSASSEARYSSYGVYYTLRSGEAADAIAAIDELVSKRDAGAGPELAKALAHPEARVRRRAARALRELGLDRALLGAMKDEALDASARTLAALEVSELSDRAAAFEGLRHLAVGGTPEQALPAIEALAAYRDPEPAPALEVALESPHGEARRAAARALATVKEDDSLSKMAAAAAAHPEDADVIEAAMVALLAAAERHDELKDRLGQSRDPRLKRVTYWALGRAAQDAGVFGRYRDELEAGVVSGEALVRGGAVLGLSVTGQSDELTLIAPLASDADAGVRRDVARALAGFPAGEGTSALMKLVADTSPSVVAAAVAALGERSEVAATADVIKLLRGGAPAVREAVVSALPRLSSPENQPDIIGALASALFDSEQAVKAAAIAALGEFSDPLAIQSIGSMVRDADPTLRHAAFAALANTQHSSALELIAVGLESEAPATRLAALDALEALGDAAAVSKIEALLAGEQDEDVKLKAAEVITALRS